MGEARDNELVRVDGVRGAAGGGWTWRLGAGGALWIADGRDSQMEWLDWLTGISPPPVGEIFWKGVEWRRRGPDEAAAERGRMGCVFASGGLLANLDLDENAWLPSRMHRRAGAAESIGRWAEFFGCGPLPQVRAPFVSESVRRRVAWTRAFAGRPELLVLERPLRDAASGEKALLFEGVRQVRAEGCAVVWLEERMDAESRAALAPLAEAVPATA